jgi:hypothetical protein
MAGTIDLSIVVPAFNESRRLDTGLGRLLDAVATGAIDPGTTEIVVVDDGSTDDTAAVAGRLLAPLPHVRVLRQETNRGKGAAVRLGVAEARGALIAFGDADMAIDPDQFPLLVAALGRADVAIGSRSLPGARSHGGTTHRRAMGRVFNALVNALTRLGIGDTQCGFKGFRAPVARLLFHCSVVEGFAFDVELLLAARHLGLGVEEVPVRWHNVGGTRIRPLADSVDMATDIVVGWARRRAPAAIPALAVAPSPPGSTSAPCLAASAAGSSLPVLGRPDGGATVLFPLGSRTEIERVTAALVASGVHDPHSLARTSVSLASLRAGAPIRIVEQPKPAEPRPVR